MLRYLRENTGNWIIKIFLGIIVIVFVFLGVGSLGSKRNDSVATINDEPITIKEYQQAYKALVNQYRNKYKDSFNDDLLKLLNAKKQALDTLIDRKIIMNQADKLNITVSDKELRANLLAQKAFQKDGKFNIDQYKKVLNLNSLNPEIYEQQQSNALRLEKLRNMVLSAVNVSDLEAKDWYRFQNSKMAVDYLHLYPEKYTDIHPDESQLGKYYSENQDKYKSAPKLKAAYIKFAPKDYKESVNVTKDQIQVQYEQQIKKYQIPEKIEASHILIRVGENAAETQVNDALKKALDIYKKVMEGQDFKTLAKQYSEDSSKNSGGYLGKFDRKTMVKPFGDKAFSLKPGEVGEPVRTPFGWHIIKVTAKFDATTKTVEQVSSAIKKELEQKEIQNIAYDKAGEAFDAVIDGDDFEQVALIAEKKIKNTNTFDISGQGLAIVDNRGFAKTAFDLPMDTISDVKQLGEDYYLIKVVEKIAPVIQELEPVKAQVTKDLISKLQVEQAQKDVKAVLKKALEAKDLRQAAAEYKLEVKSTKLFSRGVGPESINNSPEFIEASFSMTQEKQIYPEVIKAPNGYYVIGFKEKKMPVESEILENLKSVKDQIIWSKNVLSFQAWVKEVKKDYKIDYDPNILN